VAFACQGGQSSGDAAKAEAKTEAKTEAKADAKTETRSEAKADDGPPTLAEAGSARTWTFDDEAGGVPDKFKLAETGPAGTPATWSVVERLDAPSPKKAFGITSTKNGKDTYNVALIEDTAYFDLDVAVMIRPVSGELDQGGGPIWRAKDANNYYLARWNPLEKNVRFYVVVSGHRSTLAKADVDLDPAAWHELRVIAEGSHLTCMLDDEPVMTIDDTSLTKPGMIGLWTKADAATLFDDLSVTPPG
jgi:hypothetical protein